MASLTALFSSSKANCTLISIGSTNVLVDFGASFKAVGEALSFKGLDINDIDAVLITHEHSDHIKGLKVFSSKCNAPIFSSAKTLEALSLSNYVGNCAKLFEVGEQTVFKDIKIKRFAVSHDSVDAGGYTLSFGETAVGICTDTGILTDEIKRNLLGCKAVLIESNHDLKMLQNGPYPPELKLRISGEKGHLSNNTCASFLPTLLKSGTDRFVLGHLSENNNLPMLASSCATASLMDIGAKQNEDYLLSVAKPKTSVSQYF